MKLTSDSFQDQQAIPARYALGVPDPSSRIGFGDNRNPQLAWSDLPAGTRSLVLICHDPDAPSQPDDVNKEGRLVPKDLPRADFYHWVLVDLPPELTQLGEGEFAQDVVPKGKPGPEAPHASRQGVNSYTDWFAGDPEMAGDYFGYDGPCPPWNDSIPHRYQFTLYATDLERCPVDGTFTGADVLQAIEGHVLAEARLTGRYSLNPDVPA